MRQFHPKFMTAIGQASVDCDKGVPSVGGFAAALMTCDAMSVFAVSQDDTVTWSTPVGKEKAKTVFVGLHGDLERMELKASAATAKKLVDAFDAQRLSAKLITILSDDLCKRLKDEMHSRLFYSVDLDKQRFVTETNLFGDAVGNQFPSATLDIEEAGKCIAFERWTASVMHSMRILQFGLNALARDLGISCDDSNWRVVIDQIEAAVKKVGKHTSGPDWKQKEQFCSEAALQFRHFKNAWRNHVMHARQSYDEERATAIFHHVEEFMKHLATRLSEVP